MRKTLDVFEQHWQQQRMQIVWCMIRTAGTRSTGQGETLRLFQTDDAILIWWRSIRCCASETICVKEDECECE